MGLTSLQTRRFLRFFSVANRRAADGDKRKTLFIQTVLFPRLADACGHYGITLPDWLLPYAGTHKSFAFVVAQLCKSRNVDTEPRIPKGQPHGGEWTADKPNAFGHQPNDPSLVALAKQQGVAVPPKSWGLQHHSDTNARYSWTWRDAKGIQQQIYSAYGQEERERKKLQTIEKLGQKLPSIRQQFAKDLKRPDAEPERVAAVVGSIIDQTTMRIGSEVYAQTNGTYGASSMRKDHVQVQGDTVTFNFSGKHSKEHTITLKDKLVANALRHLQTLPGERLMQFHTDNKGDVAPMTEDRVNDYLRPFGISAKSFRTYHATKMAKELLDEFGPPQNEKDAAKKIRQAVVAVATKLGNTPAVCKSSYISPKVLSDYAYSFVKEKA